MEKAENMERLDKKKLRKERDEENSMKKCNYSHQV